MGHEAACQTPLLGLRILAETCGPAYLEHWRQPSLTWPLGTSYALPRSWSGEGSSAGGRLLTPAASGGSSYIQFVVPTHVNSKGLQSFWFTGVGDVIPRRVVLFTEFQQYLE